MIKRISALFMGSILVFTMFTSATMPNNIEVLPTDNLYGSTVGTSGNATKQNTIVQDEMQQSLFEESFPATQGNMIITEGLFEKNGKTYYQNSDGTLFKGEKNIGGHWYYFDVNDGHRAEGFTTLPDGRKVYYTTDKGMLYGRQTISDKEYIFDYTSGNAFTGEKNIGGYWYYFDATDGHKAVGWTNLPDGRKVYYTIDKGMLYGEHKIDNKICVFNIVSGNLIKETFVEGLIVKNGQTFYQKTDGTFYKGEKNIGGYWYYFDANDGHRAEGFTTLPDGRKVYYTTDKGMLYGEHIIDNKICVFHIVSGNLIKETFVEGLIVKNGQTFYQKTDGTFFKGEKNIGGYWYYFDATDGHKAVGWTNLPDGRKVYYTTDKGMLYGEHIIDNKIYVFNIVSGNLMNEIFVEGLIVKNGQTFYQKTDGTFYKGEKNIGGHWYYFDANDGHRAEGFTTLPDGRKVFYSKDKGMLYGEQTISGKEYLFDYTSGNVFTGEKNIGGHWYYFDATDGHKAMGWTNLPDGRKVYYSKDKGMLYGKQIINDKEYLFDETSGNAFTGEKNIGGYWYYFDITDGHKAVGWTNLPDGRKVYYTTDKGMLYGLQVVDLKAYKFSETSGNFIDAPKLNGLTNVNGNFYFFENGTAKTGEINIDGKWFYFNAYSGSRMLGFVNLPDGRYVYYTADKGMNYGWVIIGKFRYHFSEVNGTLMEKTPLPQKGIDVSSFQGHINWKQVADSGVTFAILRAMVWSGNASSGGYVVDPYFYENVEGAKANGVKVGAYIYSTAFDESEIRGEVDFFVNMMAPLKASGFAFDLPVYVDYEDKSIVDNIGSYDRRTELLKYEMDLISANGYHTGMYMNLNWARNIVNAASLQNQGYDLWLAQWGPNMTWTNATPAMWQYSNSGSVPGISGRVDLDYVYKDYSYIKGSAGSGITKKYTVYDINSQRKVTDTMLNILAGIVNNEVGGGLGLTGMDRASLWKAQAVAAHSWLLYHYENQNTTPSVGLKTDGEYESVKNTVYTVQDKVAIYGGRPINAMYGASCNGFTNSAAAFYGTAVPYLTNVDSHWEKEWSLSGSLTNKTYTSRRSSIESIVGAGAVASTSPANWVSVTRDNYGYVTSVRMCGQNVTVSNAYDNLYGVVSGDFNPSYAGGETWQITNNGKGHCIGMSQWGAAAMVANGYSWDAIVRHYYPGTTISSY